MKNILDPVETYFIAEIGKNFIDRNGDMSVEECLLKAKKLIKAAHESGADAVKFQTHTLYDEVANVDITSPHFNTMDRFNWVKKNERMTPLEDFFIPVKEYCNDIGITFFSTPMSKGAAKKLSHLDMPFWKIGSADITDFVMGHEIAKKNKPVIISTGMVNFDELDKVVKFYEEYDIPLIILYCVSEYPCPLDKFNLNTILNLSNKYPNHLIGFSDHSVDSHQPVLQAIQLGAKVIEKHFSFSRSLWGSDHKASLTPKEFKEMIDLSKSNINIENSEILKGQIDQELPGASNLYRPFFEKTMVASRDIKKGEILSHNDIWAMRPKKILGGLSPIFYKNIIGKKLLNDIKKATPFIETEIENF